jgi:hypothetical protein
LSSSDEFDGSNSFIIEVYVTDAIQAHIYPVRPVWNVIEVPTAFIMLLYQGTSLSVACKDDRPDLCISEWKPLFARMGYAGHTIVSTCVEGAPLAVMHISLNTAFRCHLFFARKATLAVHDTVRFWIARAAAFWHLSGCSAFKSFRRGLRNNQGHVLVRVRTQHTK